MSPVFKELFPVAMSFEPFQFPEIVGAIRGYQFHLTLRFTIDELSFDNKSVIMGESADDVSGQSVSLSSDGSVMAIRARSRGLVSVYEWTGSLKNP
ncbi:MAG: hypothetical protein P8J18_04675 [Halieaceae bacterium]|nr:hypothetical protein [Halieaceae bacterium]